MISKEQLATISEVFATASIVGVGWALGGTVGAGIMAGIGINLGSDILQKGSTYLKERWLSAENGVLNHDIQRALVRSFVKALVSLEARYFELPEALTQPREKKEAIRDLFKQLKEAAPTVFVASLGRIATEQEVKEYLYGEPLAARDKFWERVEGTKLVYTYYGEHVRDFLRDNVNRELVSWFGEELKLDNSECNKAWRAFQRMLLEGVLAELEVVKEGQHLIQQDLETLRSLRDTLDEVKDAIDRRLLSGFTLIPFLDLQQSSRTQLQQEFETRVRNRRYFPDSYLPRKTYDTQFQSFLTSSQKVLVVLADAGLGKTNTLSHWADQCIESKHVVFFQEAFSERHFDEELREHLKLGFPVDEKTTPITLLALIEGELIANGVYLVWFIDTLDKMPNAQGFVDELSRILEVSVASHIKIVLSCRTIAWGNISYLEATPQPVKLLTDVLASEVHIEEFSREEVESLYHHYQLKHPCLKPISEVNRGVLYQCRIPLVFSLLVQAYASERNEPFPNEAVNALAEFFKALIEGRDKTFKEVFLMDLVEILLENATDRMKVTDVYAEARRLGVGIQRADLQMENDRSYLSQFVNSNLLQYEDEEVSFSYDSVFEYLLAASFANKISMAGSVSAQKTIIGDLVSRLTSSTNYPALRFSINYVRELVSPAVFKVLTNELISVIEVYASSETDEEFRQDSFIKVFDYHSIFLPEGQISIGLDIDRSPNERWFGYQGAFYSLMALREHCLVDLLQAVSRNKGRERVLFKLFYLIFYIAYNAISELVKCISHDDEEIQLCASWAFFEMLETSQELLPQEALKEPERFGLKREEGDAVIPTGPRWAIIRKGPFPDYTSFKEYKTPSRSEAALVTYKLITLDSTSVVQALINNLSSDNEHFRYIANATIFELWLISQHRPAIESTLIKNISHPDTRVRRELYVILVLFVEKLEAALPSLHQILTRLDIDEEERSRAHVLRLLIADAIVKRELTNLPEIATNDQITAILRLCQLQEADIVPEKTRENILPAICSLQNQETKLLLLLVILSYFSRQHDHVVKMSQSNLSAHVAEISDESIRAHLQQSMNGVAAEEMKELGEKILAKIRHRLQEIGNHFNEELAKLEIPKRDLEGIFSNLKGPFYPPQLFKELAVHFKATGNLPKLQECEENEIALRNVLGWLSQTES
jgi:hypothetical protein